ncbi:hypothetical protein L6452_01987 [Arctium lappa]|uniref:Uncharacterized protein n=1 Tax=Arctium lappa TaxID=4217 RepID=A0ACB9FIK7_ARCLA|nr:hypothetical protein L6452_01987 [Arctium lappa]
MWLSRKKSSNSNQGSPRCRTPPSFNRHSFKNIGDLLGDDDKNVATTNDLNKDQQQQKKNQEPSCSSPTSSPRATAKRHSVFHRVRLANQFSRSLAAGRPKTTSEKLLLEVNNAPPLQQSEAPTLSIRIPGAEKLIIVYMTSLRAVRPTFEACRTVRSILQGFRVAVDERDLSMDSSFKNELQKIMSQGGEMFQNGKVTLPRVFIGGRYVGDGEDIRTMNETGELKKMVEGLPAVSRGVCEGCGDFRFVICHECNGSRKFYKEKGGFRSCTTCNKNGLIRCHSCWAAKL